ncbi:MAG: hypothetical protein WC750_04575 [Patescibacteria group bacterium]
MNTQKPEGKAPDAKASSAIGYPRYMYWEVRYPDGEIARGICLVANAEVDEIVRQKLAHESSFAELRPTKLIRYGSLRFCPEHDQCVGDYNYCLECGQPTEAIPDPEVLTGQVVTERYCPEHGDLTDDFFCHDCGRRSLLYRIGVV